MIKALKKVLNNAMLRNIVIVGSISLLVKFVAFFKEVLVSSTFGLSLLLDTFLISTLIPSFIFTVFVGSLNNIFIPNYIKEKKENGDLGAFQGIVLSLMSLIMIFFIILIYLTSDTFVEVVFPDKDFEYYSLIKRQLKFVLPSLIFMGFSTVLSGLLEIENKFFIANIGAILFPATTIFLLLFANKELGDLVLAIGFLAGTILSFLYLLIQALRNNVIFLSKPKLNDNSRVMLREVPHKMISGFFAGSNAFVDQYFAAQLIVGSVAAINYGSKIPKFSLAIIIMSIGKVILPHFSKIVAVDIKKGFEHVFKIIKLSFAMSASICLLLYIFTPEIISLIFERNKFTEEDTIVVSSIQRVLLIYIPFYLAGLILVKFLTTINKNKFMAKISFISFILNIALNYILMSKYGLFGLALGTTIVFIFRSLIYFYYTLKLRKQFF